jgi:hypothetical protein
VRREVIGPRFEGAAGLGRQHGAEAGQAAARGVLTLAAAATTTVLLLLAIMAVTVLWFGLLYLWFVVLGGMLDQLSPVWDLLSAFWPFLAALGLILYGLRRLWQWPCGGR